MKSKKNCTKLLMNILSQTPIAAASAVLVQASELGQTTFTPSIELLKILIVGKTEDVNKYQYLLDEFTKNYPETEAAAYARKLLETSRNYH